MATETKRRPGGARPNGPLLERDQIIDEAMAITAQSGLSGLSMRQLGERLDVTSMAIYWYVRNRGELVDAVAERITALIPIPADDLPWEEWLRQVCLDTYEVLVGYAGIADHILSARDTPAAMLDRQQRAIAVLESAGLPPDDATSAVTVIGTFVLAQAQFDAHRRLDEDDPPHDGRAILRSGVDLIVAGIRAHLP